MWIKILYCTEDLIYAKRLAAYLDKIYGEKLTVDIVSSVSELNNYIDGNIVDVVLYGHEFESLFPRSQKGLSYSWAVMADEIYEENDNNISFIEKYQSADQIYKAILEVYSKSKNVKQFNIKNVVSSQSKVYAFVSASGGVGTSTVARAFAKRCAVYEKVLYLNLGLYHFNESENDGNGIDDILVALKSRRNILPIKMESSVTTLGDRVNTYGASRNIIDLLELNPEDINNLLEGLRGLKEYKKIILDVGSGISSKEIAMMKMADSVIYVIDESDLGIHKYERFITMIRHLEQRDRIPLGNKLYIFRNKVKQNFENDTQNFQNAVIGWAPYITTEANDAVISRIAQSDSFRELEIKYVE